jgi:hypothetical protein
VGGRRRYGGGGVVGDGFGDGGPLLCSAVSGGAAWQIRRLQRARRSPEPRRAFPPAGVLGGGAGF